MGEIKDITSGTGFSGLFPDETSIGDSGVAGYKYKPVSRWTDHPYQLYREGDTEQTVDPNHIYFGIMAYHAEGIKEVDFVLNGGSTVTVTEQELNPYTNLPEYCVRINKADVINPVDSDPTSDNEQANNMELRAIVRPNSGVPRIHQHDKDVVLGEDSSLVVGHFFGYSGGKGDHFFDKKTVPGEFSMLGTVLKSNSQSSLPNITVYMDPDGNDNNDGTRESPLKTTGGALEKIRDIAAEDTSRHITEDGTGDQYVDVSRSEIVLLEGTYTAAHYGEPVSRKVGNESSNNRTPLCKRGWFIIKGDPDVEREDVIFELTDEEAILGSDQKVWSEHVSDFSLLDQNRNLHCLKIEHITIKRPQTRVGLTSWGMRVKNQADSMVAGHTADCDLLWFHDIRVENYSVGQIHSKGSFMKNERVPDQCCFISGTPDKPSKILGGDETTTAFSHWCNVDVIKNDGDNLKQAAPAFAVSCKGNNGSFGNWRRIWFDPDVYPEYAKFNGYYGAIRYDGEALGTNSNHELDENGSRFYEPGTLQEYIRIHNLNSPEGVTLSWPKNPRNVQHPTDKSNPAASTDDSSLGDVTVTGTIWQKVNHENFLNLNVPWQEDPISETNFNTTDYAHWGEKYGVDGNTEYFGDVNEKEAPTLTGMVLPKGSKVHIINPQKSSKWFFTTKDEAASLPMDEQVELAKESVGAEIYDPGIGKINEDHKFYEPIFCTMLKYEDSNLGITAWGQILFDASKPIAANPDVEGWGTTQDFVFRLAGTTFPSAGLLQDIEGVGLNRQFNSSWPYTKAQFQPSPNERNDRGQFQVAWAAGITSQGLSLEHRGTADTTVFAETEISANNTHPIESWCSLGSRDTTHTDSVQWFSTTGVDSINTVENSIYAYCNFLIDGQAGHFDVVSSPYVKEYLDVAFVNNVWSNIPIPTASGLNMAVPALKHHIWYHNTVHNCSTNFKSFTNYAVNEDNLREISLDENRDDYLFSIYGDTLLLEKGSDAILLRNNFFSKLSHLDDWVFRGTGQPYTDTDGTDRQGVTWPFSADGITPLSDSDPVPVELERNFRWWGGPMNSNANSQNPIMNVLEEENIPKFKAMIPYNGGSGYPEGIQTPNDLSVFGDSKFDGFQPEDDSPLVGGGTLEMELHVPFDMNRKRRIGHATIGAYEVDSSYITEDNEYVPQTTKFNDIQEDLIPSVTGNTLMSFALAADDHERLYAKRIKVRATKTLDDGTVSVRFSDNILRLQASRDGQLGIENSNFPTGSATTRSLLIDTPDDVTYYFTGNNSTVNPVSSYYVPDIQAYEDDVYEGGDQGGETFEYGPDLEFETTQSHPSQNTTWLDTSYDISSIKIYGSTYQTPVGNRNKIKLFFGHIGETAGATHANEFHNAYAAAGGTLEIPFPNGISYFVDKTAGGMTAHGSSLESYFYTTTPGTTVSLTGQLPTGEVVIEKPTGL
jgi:hypothetical protein